MVEAGETVRWEIEEVRESDFEFDFEYNSEFKQHKTK